METSQLPPNIQIDLHLGIVIIKDFIFKFLHPPALSHWIKEMLFVIRMEELGMCNLTRDRGIFFSAQ